MKDDTAVVAKRTSLPYRTAFQTKSDFRGATQAVRDELGRWLQKKGYDVDAFDAGLQTIGSGVVLLYAATNNSTGWQLRERRKDGVTWVSTLTVAHDGTHPDDEWISVNIEANVPRGYPAPTASGSARAIRSRRACTSWTPPPRTGAIYVGYFGRHMPNTRTS